MHIKMKPIKHTHTHIQKAVLATTNTNKQNNKIKHINIKHIKNKHINKKTQSLRENLQKVKTTNGKHTK